MESDDGFVPDAADGFTPDAQGSAPPLVANIPAEEHALAYRAAIGRHLADPNDPIANKVLSQQQKLQLVAPDDPTAPEVPLDKPYSANIQAVTKATPLSLDDSPEDTNKAIEQPYSGASAEQQLEATHQGLEEYAVKTARPAAAMALERQKQNLDPPMSLDELIAKVKIANGTHGPMARLAGEVKDLGGDLGTKAYHNALHPADTLGGRFSQLWRVATTKGDGPSGWEAIRKLPSQALAGVAEGGDQLADLGVSVGNEALDLALDLAGKSGAAGDSSDNVALVDALAIMAKRNTNEQRQKAAAALGLSPDDPVVKAIGTGLSIGLTAPLGGPSLAAPAEAAVNAGARTLLGGGRGFAGVADLGLKAAPAVAAATGLGGMIAHGGGGLIEHLLEMSPLAGYLPRSGKGLVASLADATTGRLKTIAQSLLDNPSDKVLTQKLGEFYSGEGQRMMDQLGGMGEDVRNKAMQMTGGKYTYSASDKGLSKEMQQAAALRDGANSNIRKASFFNSDAATAVNRGVKAGVKGALEGGAVGTAFGGLNVQPGASDNTQMLEQSGGEGAILGGLMSPLALDAESRQRATQGLQDRGANALSPDDPQYDIHQQNMKALPQWHQNFVNRIAGLADANGTKTVLLNSDQMQGEVGYRTAGAYDRDKNTLFLNSDQRPQDAGGHELGHAVGQALGFSDPTTPFGAAVERMLKENADVNAKPKRDYEDDLANDVINVQGGQKGDKGFILNSPDKSAANISLGPQEVKDEAVADLGHRLIKDIGPEGYYGGRSLDQKLGAAIKGLVPKGLRPDTTGGRFGFKISPEVRDMFQNELFNIGKMARGEETRPRGAASLPVPPEINPPRGDLGAAPEVKGAIKGDPLRDAVMPDDVAMMENAEAALVQLGYDKNTAKERVAAAHNDLINGNKLPKVEDLVRGALARGGAKPLMPSYGIEGLPEGEKQEPFYSQLEKTIKDKMPNRAHTNQVRAIIEGGSKKAERDWNSPVRDLLDQNRVVTKQEMLEAARAGTPKIKVAPAEGADYPSIEELQSEGWDHDYYPSEEQMREMGYGGGTKYDQYQLPGGKNYKETLLTLPEAGNVKPFRSSHFDEDNIIGHLRTNDRVTTDGKTATHAEEVQSDLHQKGRKEGYRPKSPLGELPEGWMIKKLDRPEGDREFGVLNKNGELVRFASTPEKAKEAALYTLNEGSHLVPDMPFKGEAWKRLLLRQLIKQAVDAGHDMITWTTGEQQKARYDLSKHLDSVEIRKLEGSPNKVSVYGSKGNSRVIHKNTEISKLDEVVGKELAQKAQEDLANKSSQIYSGLDLKLGGEGMKGFYDRELVNLANDIGKKYGAKVEDAEIPQPFDGKLQGREGETAIQAMDRQSKGTTATVHSLPITEALRNEVQTKGQPMFMPSYGLSEATIADKQGAIEAGLKPWEIRLHSLLKKEDGVGFDGLPKDEQVEIDQLTQKAKKEYGTFDQWYLHAGGKQHGAKDLFGKQYMPAPREEDVAGRARRSIMDKGGVTINVHGDEPTEGFAYAPDKTTETKIPADQFSDSSVDDYLEKHKEALQQEGAHLGGWKDDNGTPVLDISYVQGDKLTALIRARAAQQDAIHNLSTHEDINVNEGLKDYTPEQIAEAQTTVPPQHKAGGELGGLQVPRETRSAQGLSQATVEAPSGMDQFMPPTHPDASGGVLDGSSGQQKMEVAGKTGESAIGDRKNWDELPPEDRAKLTAHFMGEGRVAFMPSFAPHAIKEAAIKMPDGEIYTGRMHPMAEDKALADGYTEADLSKAVHGFITNKREFLNREEAMQRALEQNQIDPENYDKNFKTYFNAKTSNKESLESSSFRMSRAYSPSLGAIEHAKDLAVASDKASTSVDDEFFQNIWPKFLRETGKLINPVTGDYDKAADEAANGVAKFLRANPKFADYYSKDWDATDSHLEGYLGRELTPDEKSYVRMATALTSPNTGLQGNTGDAIRSLLHYIGNGNMDKIVMGRGDGGGRAIKSSPFTLSSNSNKAFSLQAIDKLVATHGSPVAVAEYLKGSDTLPELRTLKNSLGYDAKQLTDEPAIKQVVKFATGQDKFIPRAFIFGKKVGSYMMNHLGATDFTTVDIWESRFLRSQFEGLFDKSYGIPRTTEEFDYFGKFIDIFNKKMREKMGQKLGNSALQAARWYYILDATKKAGYEKSTTSETISHYTKKYLESVRQGGTRGREGGDEGIGGTVDEPF